MCESIIAKSKVICRYLSTLIWLNFIFLQSINECISLSIYILFLEMRKGIRCFKLSILQLPYL